MGPQKAMIDRYEFVSIYDIETQLKTKRNSGMANYKISNQCFFAKHRC